MSMYNFRINSPWAMSMACGLVLAACSEGGSDAGDIDQASTVMRCNEIMYNAGTANALEWIEIQIDSGLALSSMLTSELRIEGAVEYAFPDSALAIGERIVVASDTAAFRAKYPIADYPVRLFGPFIGRLDNNAEVVEVKLTGTGDASCRYGSDAAWPNLAAGGGHSLVYIGGDASQPESYAASKVAGGTPGAADEYLAPLTVRVNEVRPLSTKGDAWVELYNTGTTTVDISGWLLADVADGTGGYALPKGTTLAAGAYLTITQAEWESTATFMPAQSGESVYLIQTVNGAATGITAGLTYPAVEAGMSAGIATLSTGNLTRGPLAQATSAAANSDLYMGPVYIAEIHYNPQDSAEAEYIEIASRSDAAVDLGSPASWVVSGINFTFPVGTTLPAKGRIMLVRAEDIASDTAAYRAALGIPTTVPIFAYSGKLSNRGEELVVQTPIIATTAGYAYTWSDVVLYEDEGAWPLAADGEGSSLVRSDPELAGSDPAAWSAATPTPGK